MRGYVHIYVDKKTGKISFLNCNIKSDSRA